MLKKLILFVFAVILAVPSVAEAMGQSGSTQPGQDLAGDYFENLFSPEDKQIILEFYGLLQGEGPDKSQRGDKSMPPGLKKRDQLPPGLQKYFQNHGALPPGLAKRSLPQDLEQRLSPLNPDYERVIVDNDILLIETATQVLIDILTNVVTK
jgi:hypothetical protein